MFIFVLLFFNSTLNTDTIIFKAEIIYKNRNISIQMCFENNSKDTMRILRPKFPTQLQIELYDQQGNEIFSQRIIKFKEEFIFEDIIIINPKSKTTINHDFTAFNKYDFVIGNYYKFKVKYFNAIKQVDGLLLNQCELEEMIEYKHN